MADIPVGYNRAGIRGTPAFEAFDPLVTQALLAGSEPAIQRPTRILLADSQNLAQFTVVGILNGKATIAVSGTTYDRLGVLAHAATSGVGNTTKYGEVYLTGNFNVDSDSPLVFDASYDSLAKKVAVAHPTLQFRTRRATGSTAGAA